MITKHNLYYAGTRKGVSKESGKAYMAVDLFIYSERFESWTIKSFFVDELPAICATLKSGDYVAVEIRQDLLGAVQLVGISAKIADSPLKKS